MQVHDTTTGPQRLPIFRPQYRTTSGSQYHTPQVAQLGKHSLLPITKALLPLDIENPGNIGSRPLLDFLVGILERKTQLFGKQTPDGALSSTHRAYKDHIPH